MYCENCGAKIPDVSRFCPSCGAKQGNRAPRVSKQEELNTTQIKHLQMTTKQTAKKQNVTKTPKKAVIFLSTLAIVAFIAVGIIIVRNVNENQKRFSSNFGAKSSTQTSSLPKKSSVRPKGAQAADGVVNFDLSKYKDYGSYSCGRVWVKESQWVDRLDGYYDMFAYLDIDGNQISPWLNEYEYFTADYVHDFLVIEKVKGFSSDRTHSHIFCIYDLNFNLIEELECSMYGSVIPFNEYGYSFAADTKSFGDVFIDKDGFHNFAKGVYFSDPKKIQTTDKYFLIDGHFVCDHEGKLLVNVEKAVDKYTKNRGYTREKYNLSDDYFIRIDKITNDTSLDITFKAKNKQSNNEVVFKGTLDFNGNFIEGPTKI